MAAEELLASWNDTPTRQAIVDYVARVTGDGPDHVPPHQERRTFDNDGTLWCEKPMPIQLAFILEQLVAMADHDESLRAKQPWKAAHGRDMGWLSGVITKHYAGDDSDIPVLMGGIWPPSPASRSTSTPTALELRAGPNAPDERPGVPAVRLPPDGGAAALPRGQRLHDVHRLRRRPRLHAALRRRDVR